MDIGKVKYWQHPSKTKCVFVDKSESPIISIDVWCKAGVAFEDENNVGSAHFLEHMLFKGSESLKSGEFDFRIESLGGLSNASTGYDDVHYYVDIPTSNLEEALYLLTNLVFMPCMDKNDFELEKKVILEEIMQNFDQKEDRIFNHFIKRIWKGEAYNKSILGDEDNIKKLKLSDLLNFHKKRYTIQNSCISIVGKLPKNYLKILENCQLNFINKNESNNRDNLKVYQSIRSGREVISINEIEFSRVLISWLIPSSKQQKLIVGYEILSSILSDGRNSILNRELRENDQLVESVYSGIYPGEFGGLFIIEASCENKNILKVENIINNLLIKLINANDLDNRIRKAIRIVKSNYIFNLETSSQLSSFLGSNLLWGRLNPHNYLVKNLEYWENVDNFKEITNLFLENKYTLLINNK